MNILSVQDARDLDRRTIDSGVSGGLLMERAGEGLCEAVLLAAAPGKRISLLVVCGKGNNGGDGFAAARLCAHAGHTVTCLALFPCGAYSGHARSHLDKLAGTGVNTVHCAIPSEWPDFNEFNIIIDALFGTGFSGEIKEPMLAECIDRINRSSAIVIAADTPSGINSDTGEVPGPAVVADITVTMGAPKLGQFFFPARSFVGDLRVKDIGYIPEELSRTGLCRAIDRIDMCRALPQRPGNAHKNQCGRVLVVAGSTGYTGAAALCARAAQKSGAGLVSLCIPRSLDNILEIKLTEEITCPLADGNKGYLTEKNADAILALAGEYQVLAIGPGLGRNASTAAMVRKVVARSPVPVVLDADGINAYEKAGHLLKKAKSPVIITPHDGELKRLTGEKEIGWGPARIRALRNIQKELGITIVLKGGPTLVVSSTCMVNVNTTGNPGMATAGAGDVLTGLISGLYAQTHNLEQAVLTGVYLHGLAGDYGAMACTEYCLTAGDIITFFPQAFMETAGIRKTL
ncbi:MAG: hypothetical protein A2268_02190 [Candidatus Raymondbacteria bacterium RifOxyA12_full_50_37]|uniref:Bifunctional NAD(P)H-hydrate repair enzyme n=1 Tax=Candidatus Raymondbacteria bacterium RIFOXYD12_FULL_49_13 TaxID=1817890 RepID=A0A1F7F5K2_UNCRA|nr:MAG: hypothetical protein A2268_02190 [Candidatus Raymondbacteria bacterium RifOxyA12_full_50_37]OGJ92236.1 MAG: hypothetical protein A2248_11020 [Candidatus Raymondbacteria bacterium RIFOXYA2_FULL_49_16]OGJ98562.1 MAG: hypothetical protein A2453_06820 [Candidatus Raymondbacteria bacterium RIFOXYC2_FULL_50_21]OGK01863.1 MAG: hypothetical protein A2519_04715 [Candidatus Raymondbacteria bacterium RIFOXYD12_FULL_49_13]OGP44231.1 MAG: hypothetical protein A2324_06945 [Candidatus Raymondbacteria 